VWDPSGKSRDALRSIVADFGTRALSTPSILENVLHDLLPDSPRQVSLIVAAGGSSVASSLQEHMANGMDPGTAVRLASAQLAEQTPYDAAGCRWVTAEFALALGHPVPDEPAAAPTVEPAPAPAQETVAPVMPVAPLDAPRPDQAETVLPPTPVTARGDRASGGRRRRVPVLIAAVVVVLGGLTVGAAVSHTWPFKASGPTPATLKKLLPDDVRNCTNNVSTFKFTGLSSVLGCNDDAINGLVFAYQFDNGADFQTSLAALNKGESFDPSKAGSNCPPQSSTGKGVVTWSNKLFPSAPGQTLECFVVFKNGDASLGSRPSYVWAAPSEDTFLQAVGGANVSMSTLDMWWSNHAGPFNK
jgi:hypothetical protein